MRVLHLTDRWTDRGGAHHHLRSVIAAVADLGHEVHVAAGGADDHVAPPAGLAVLPALARRGRTAHGLDALVRRVRPDVVHVHTVMNPDVLEWAAAQPAVVTVQDHRHFCPGRGKWTPDGRACTESMRPELCAPCVGSPRYFEEVDALTRQRLAAVGRLRVVVLSSYMRAELAAVGVSAERVSVVPPFVHGLEPSGPGGPPCILFAGRLTEAKGVRDAVAAWRMSGLQLPLVFAGTGPLREEVERAGHTVLGWVPHASMGAVYRRARALLFPPRWQEPFGIAGLEALSLGVPVAAWDSGGVREWHGERGLVARGDLEGLAARLVQAAAGPPPPPPAGFERGALMDRLLNVYAAASGAGPALA